MLTKAVTLRSCKNFGYISFHFDLPNSFLIFVLWFELLAHFILWFDFVFRIAYSLASHILRLFGLSLLMLKFHNSNTLCLVSWEGIKQRLAHIYMAQKWNGEKHRYSNWQEYPGDSSPFTMLLVNIHVIPTIKSSNWSLFPFKEGCISERYTAVTTADQHIGPLQLHLQNLKKGDTPSLFGSIMYFKEISTLSIVTKRLTKEKFLSVLNLYGEKSFMARQYIRLSSTNSRNKGDEKLSHCSTIHRTSQPF